MPAIADDLHARGADVSILTGKLSGACPPAGRAFFFATMAAFAELGRDMIRERTMAGLTAARPGRNGGRPTVMDAGKLAAAKARWERGERPPRSPGHSASTAARSTAASPQASRAASGRTR